MTKPELETYQQTLLALRSRLRGDVSHLANEALGANGTKNGGTQAPVFTPDEVDGRRGALSCFDLPGSNFQVVSETPSRFRMSEGGGWKSTTNGNSPAPYPTTKRSRATA